MAILDAFTQLSNAQAVTTTGASTNIIDLYSELGDAMEPGAWLRVAIQTTFTIAGSDTTMQVQFQTGDDTNFGGGVTLAQSVAIAKATLVAGYEVLVVKIPKNTKRYIRVYYILTGTASAGNVDAHILYNVDNLITDVEGT